MRVNLSSLLNIIKSGTGLKKKKGKHDRERVFVSFLLSFILLSGVCLYMVRGEFANFAWVSLRNSTIALFLNTVDAKLAMNIGDYYFNGGAYDVERALRAYRQAVQINPKIMWGHYQMSRILFTQRKFDEALYEINNELIANPANLRSLYVRGLIYAYAGELSKSEDDFKRFINWTPSEWAGYNDLAWVLEKDVKYIEAERVVLSAFAAVPNANKNPWLWNALGVALLNEDRFNEAKVSFLNAQTLAQGLSDLDWQEAYPGNDPSASQSGLQTFLAVISENLKRSGE